MKHITYQERKPHPDLHRNLDALLSGEMTEHDGERVALIDSGDELALHLAADLGTHVRDDLSQNPSKVRVLEHLPRHIEDIQVAANKFHDMLDKVSDVGV